MIQRARMNPLKFAVGMLVVAITIDARSSGALGASPLSLVEDRGTESATDAPDYTIDVTRMTTMTDASGVVQGADGYAELTFGTVPGQSYLVDTTGALPASPTLSEVQAFYNTHARTPIFDPSPQIPSSSFVLVGASLPAIRTVVIVRTSSVTAYELLRLTFQTPASELDAHPVTAELP